MTRAVYFYAKCTHNEQHAIREFLRAIGQGNIADDLVSIEAAFTKEKVDLKTLCTDPTESARAAKEV